MSKLFKSCANCGSISNAHKQKHLKVEETEACVDYELYDLIKLLWENRIDTRFSCIGESCPDYCKDPNCLASLAYISFYSDSGMIKFLNLVRGIVDKRIFINTKNFKNLEINLKKRGKKRFFNEQKGEFYK